MGFKKYAYYIKGNNIALVEKENATASGKMAVAHCTLGGYTTKDTCEAAGGQWIPGSSGSTDTVNRYRSPASSVTDGIEIEYTYAPHYTITDASDTRSITSYTENGGLLKITMTATASFTEGDTILITDSNKWNGLHEVNATTSNSADLVFKTKYNGGTVTGLSSTLTYNIDLMEDESFEIDIPAYLQKALVYYLKSKLSEDHMELEAAEYFMRKFRRIVEKESNSKAGQRIMQGNRNMV